MVCVVSGLAKKFAWGFLHDPLEKLEWTFWQTIICCMNSMCCIWLCMSMWAECAWMCVSDICVNVCECMWVSVWVCGDVCYMYVYVVVCVCSVWGLVHVWVCVNLCVSVCVSTSLNLYHHLCRAQTAEAAIKPWNPLVRTSSLPGR